MKKIKDLTPPQLIKLYQDLITRDNELIDLVSDIRIFNSNIKPGDRHLPSELPYIKYNLEENKKLRQLMACVKYVNESDDDGGMKTHHDIFLALEKNLGQDCKNLFQNLDLVDAPASYQPPIERQDSEVESLMIKKAIELSLEDVSKSDSNYNKERLAHEISMLYQKKTTSKLLTRHEQVFSIPAQLLNRKQDKLSFDEEETGVKFKKVGHDDLIEVEYNGKKYVGIFVDGNEIQFANSVDVQGSSRKQAVDEVTKSNLNNHLRVIMDYHDNKIAIKEYLVSQGRRFQQQNFDFGNYKVELESINKLKFSDIDDPHKKLSLQEKCVVAKKTLEILRGHAISSPVAVAASGPVMGR